MMIAVNGARCVPGLLVGGSFMALLAANPAVAQDVQTSRQPASSAATTAAGSAQAREPQSTQDIVVTAQKSGAQSILQVPATISAFDAQTIQQARIESLGDISQLNPSVDLVQSFGRAANYLSMRGVSSTETGQPTVQVFVDGYTTGLAAGINTTLFDLERVEILEGPQATLYGANSIGGVINYITKKPGNDLAGDFRIEYGEQNTVSASGSISGPVVPDRLFAGVSVAFHHTDGYLYDIATNDPDAGHEKDVSARAALRAVFPSTTIDFSATYSYAHDGCGDCSYIPSGYDLNLNATAPFNTQLRDGEVDVNEDSLDIDQVDPHYMQRHSNTDVLTINHDFGGARLTSITGYGTEDTDIAFDLSRAATRNPNPVYATYVISNSHGKTASEELRLAGGRQDAFHWLIGGYVAHTATGSLTYLGYLLPTPIAIGNATTDNYALFGNVDLPIGNHFVISGGLRYDREIVKDDNPVYMISGTARSGEFLPRVTAQWHFNPDLMLYATASKGYKSGGVNTQTPDPTVPRTYAPEFLWNYEGGLKGRLFDGRETFTLSVFHMDWTNRQVQLLDSSGLFAYQANLGKSHINGVEFATDIDLGAGLNVNAGVTYLDGIIDRYDDLSGVSTFYGINPDLAGNRLPNAPTVRATVSPQWITPISDAWNLRLRADVSYTGVRYFDAQNLLRQNPYTLVNLYAGIERDKFELGIFANNAFDQGYHSAGNLTTVGPLMTTGAPRMIGVRARVKL